MPEQSTTIRRPQRWSQPLDASMSDADVAFLRTRRPFRDLDPAKFPRSTPLNGVLKNDTSLRRVEAGEVIIREGDYGNSAFLVLAGEVTVIARPPAMASADPLEKAPRQNPLLTLKNFFSRSKYPESRYPESRNPGQVSPSVGWFSSDGSSSSDASGDQSSGNVGESHGDSGSQSDGRQSDEPHLSRVDDRPAMLLQDFDAVIKRDGTASLGPGELFGEVAAMYRTPHAATVVASTEATILEIRWQGLRLMRGDPAFNHTLDQHYRKGWLPQHLRETPMLRFLDDETIEQLAEVTELRSYGRLEWYADYRKSKRKSPARQIEEEPIVAREGNFPTELLIVRSGFGRISVDHGASAQTTAYLGKGHLFGLEEVVHNAASNGRPMMTLQSTLRAVGMLDILAIPIEAFAEVVLPRVRRGDWPESVREWIDERDRREHSGRSKNKGNQSDRRSESGSGHQGLTGQSFASTAMMEFVIENRLNNGREAMVIDLHRCTRCDECVKACASTHDGNPRFVRTGLRHDRLQFANACMHCTDPVCMIGCPTGAISRSVSDGLVQINEPTCIGCGTCASACPYENIRMAEVVDQGGLPFLDNHSGNPIRKATKCDLCRDVSGGPACVSACPHDALARIDLSESPPLTEWLEARGGPTLSGGHDE